MAIEVQIPARSTSIKVDEYAKMSDDHLDASNPGQESPPMNLQSKNGDYDTRSDDGDDTELMIDETQHSLFNVNAEKTDGSGSAAESDTAQDLFDSQAEASDGNEEDEYGQVREEKDHLFFPREFSFPQFSRLPPELRAQIWYQFCPDLRAKSRVFYFTLPDIDPSMRPRLEAAKAVLSTNRESRELALILWPDSMVFPDRILTKTKKEPKTKTIHFNGRTDYVVLNLEGLDYHTALLDPGVSKGIFDKACLRPFLSNVRHLALPLCQYNALFFSSAIIFNCLPNLERLYMEPNQGIYAPLVSEINENGLVDLVAGLDSPRSTEREMLTWCASDLVHRDWSFCEEELETGISYQSLRVHCFPKVELLTEAALFQAKYPPYKWVFEKFLSDLYVLHVRREGWYEAADDDLLMMWLQHRNEIFPYVHLSATNAVENLKRVLNGQEPLLDFDTVTPGSDLDESDLYESELYDSDFIDDGLLDVGHRSDGPDESSDAEVNGSPWVDLTDEDGNANFSSPEPEGNTGNNERGEALETTSRLHPQERKRRVVSSDLDDDEEEARYASPNKRSRRRVVLSNEDDGEEDEKDEDGGTSGVQTGEVPWSARGVRCVAVSESQEEDNEDEGEEFVKEVDDEEEDVEDAVAKKPISLFDVLRHGVENGKKTKTRENLDEDDGDDEQEEWEGFMDDDAEDDDSASEQGL